MTFPLARGRAAGVALAVWLLLLVPGAAWALCHAAPRDDGRAFIAAKPIPGTERTLAQGLEQGTACIDLKQREEPGLRKWLQGRAQAASPTRPAGQARVLTAGAVVAAEIRGGTTDDYRIEARAGEAVDVRVTQKGIDLVLVVQDDTGATIAEVDSPNGAEGDEPATFVAARTGAYRIRVAARDANVGAGAYEIRATTRAATPRDHELEAVRTAFTAAQRLLDPGPNRDATAAAAALKTALARARALGEHDLASTMASAISYRDSSVVFAAADVPRLAGAVPLYVSRGFEARGAALRDRLAAALAYFERRLQVRPPVGLAVLARDDWQAVSGIPYGMPSASAGPTPVLFMPAQHVMFDEFAATMRTQGIPSGPIAEAVARTGLSLEQGLSLAADDVLFHELGHILAFRSGLAQPNLWYGEFLATYFSRTFLADVPGDPRVPVFADVLRQWSTVQKPAHTTLEDFERLYLGVGNENYAWYQGQFDARVLEVQKAHGIGFLTRVKTAFPEGTPQSLPVADVLSRLEGIAPGFQAWARALVERKPR